MDNPEKNGERHEGHAPESAVTRSGVMTIDVEGVVKSRLPRLARFIPRRAFDWLRRTVCEDELNTLLRDNSGLEGADFCRGVLRSLDIRVVTHFPERLPDPTNRRVVVVSNHPLGGLDGMALIDMVQRHYGGQVWFVVNDLLMHVDPLKPVFLPVNKHGRQSREALERVDRAFAGDDPIIIFPAGLVSRLRTVPINGERRRMVADLPWRKMFINRCRRYRRDIVPLFFSGQNSMKFYRLAHRRECLGLKFNIEQIYLPSEVIKSRGKRFDIYCGNMISYTDLTDMDDAEGYTRAVRGYVYRLATPGFEDETPHGVAPGSKSLNNQSHSENA